MSAATVAPEHLVLSIRDATPRPVELDHDLLIAHGLFGFEQLDRRTRSFLLLRTQLLNGFYAGGGRILAVTSPKPGNGKTYVASNVAAALSLIHPTVLIDLDLRRPALAEQFGLRPAAGMDDYLAGEATMRQTALPVAGTRLTIHPVRTPRADSAALLASDRLDRMVEALRGQDDAPLCIVDTPPVLVVDDILLIARQVDGVLLVIEEGSTRGSDLDEALRLLGRTAIVGSVLNKSHSALSRTDGYDAYYNVRA